MRRALLMVLAAAPLLAQQPQGSSSANASVTAAKGVWQIALGFASRAAEQMPESLYTFQPTKDIRTFGQLVGHVADAQYAFCAAALGEKSPMTVNHEQSTKSKAALVQAVKDAGTYCQRAYAMSDATSAAQVELFGMKMTKLGVLILNASHDYEHYGNMVTYLRLKGMVPPSSQQSP
ncbi:MAG TPA: DinB family protein [Gemmatimonadaceae bacterium]|nr:DinB family protein [Gemmatimonadaceae bacterium]